MGGINFSGHIYTSKEHSKILMKVIEELLDRCILVGRKF